jgi:zinc transport system permease protein
MEVWVDELITLIRQQFPSATMLSFEFNVRALIALVFIGLICGSVGSLVVGNRMAFFSDALAHSTFAGVAIGIVTFLVLRLPPEDLLKSVALVMIAFGILTGIAIVFVRERTSQSSDTVIGVFFAGAVGLGAILLKIGSSTIRFPTDDFLFGSLASVSSAHLIALALLSVITFGLLAWMYNGLVFANFNVSLARSRRIPLRFYNYLFVALLAVIVNLCLTAVGALLIGALLIVPAATAVNLCSDMRQLFRWSMVICLLTSLLGLWLSWEVEIPIRNRSPAHLGEGGTIVLLNVLLFFASMLIGPWLRNRPAFNPLSARPTGNGE